MGLLTKAGWSVILVASLEALAQLEPVLMTLALGAVVLAGVLMVLFGVAIFLPGDRPLDRIERLISAVRDPGRSGGPVAGRQQRREFEAE